MSVFMCNCPAYYCVSALYAHTIAKGGAWHFMFAFESTQEKLMGSCFYDIGHLRYETPNPHKIVSRGPRFVHRHHLAHRGAAKQPGDPRPLGFGCFLYKF